MQRYEKIREQIRSGDLLAWSHREPFWRSMHDFKIFCIRLFRLQPWTHVGTAWTFAGRVFVIEAVKSGVRLFPLSRAGNFGWVAMDAPWAAATECAAMAYIGDPYSELEAALAPFIELEATGKWECAKLVAFLARLDDIDLGRVYTPDAVLEKALSFDGTELVMIENDGELT
jgi:hypothetical protein